MLLESPPGFLAGPLAHGLREVVCSLGKRAVLSIQRLADVDGEAVPYDRWSTSHCIIAGGTYDYARPPPSVRNRFRGVSAGRYEGLFYQDRVLVAQVTIQSHGVLVSSVLRAAAGRIQGKLHDARWTEADGEGLVVVDESASVRGHDGPAVEWLSTEARSVRLVERLLAVPDRIPARIVYRDMVVSSQPLAGTAGLSMILIEKVKPILLAPDAALTPAQRQVAEYAAVGATVDEIARAVHSRRETVRTHLREVYRRLNVANRVELFRALRP